MLDGFGFCLLMHKDVRRRSSLSRFSVFCFVRFECHNCPRNLRRRRRELPTELEFDGAWRVRCRGPHTPAREQWEWRGWCMRTSGVENTKLRNRNPPSGCNPQICQVAPRVTYPQPGNLTCGNDTLPCHVFHV